MAKRNPTKDFPRLLSTPILQDASLSEEQNNAAVRAAFDARWRAFFAHVGISTRTLFYDSKSETILDAIARNRDLARRTLGFLAEARFPGFYVKPIIRMPNQAAAHDYQKDLSEMASALGRRRGQTSLLNGPVPAKAT